ncbi:MAG: hypothetical protein IKQ61_07870 [Spirochaetales bacterium]|nr:hypothetical protein [Spirochaetales bacterium]
MEYGLIGEKLGHSFSKVIHNMIGSYQYELQEIPKNEIDAFMRAKDFRGINVTIPYKQTVIPYLDSISDRAKKIGAVNTIVNRGSRLFGDNTDYIGLKSLIERNDILIKDRKVLILGTGGTSRTALAVVRDMEAASVCKVSRHAENDDADVKVITYDDAVRDYSDAQIIINTTPVGMFPQNENVPINIEDFPKLEGVVDVIYNPLVTRLVRNAKARNIKAANGLYMLVKQAVAASEKFFDTEYDNSLTENIFAKVTSMKQNIVLIGMPGCGKSTVGKALSRLGGRTMVDTDILIADKFGMEIPQIFAQFGEETFRNAESEVIREVSQQTGIVISTGGGAILRPENVSALKANGVIFFLDRPIEDIRPTANRPLSQDRAALQQRYNERYGIYTQTADVHIKVNARQDDIARRILKIMGK